MMKIKLFAVLGMAILIAAVSASIGMGEEDENEEVIPPNTAGFLGGGWHPAPECIQCHVSLLSEGALRAKLGSCECHRNIYTSGGDIDMGKIRQNAHGVPVCIDCHIGSGMITSEDAIPCDEVHRPHVEIDCQACHGENENIIIPESGNCDSCHSADAHAAHGNKTGDLCVACHGSFGVKYKEEGYQLIEGVPISNAPEEMTYPTISNILRALINVMFEPKEEGV